MTQLLVADLCPECGSLDVRATEHAWFRLEFERRVDIDDDAVGRLEFGCRDCGLFWD